MFTLNIPMTVADDSDGANNYPRIDERREVAIAILGINRAHAHLVDVQVTQQRRDGSSSRVSRPVLVVPVDDLEGTRCDQLCIALRQPAIYVHSDDLGTFAWNTHGFTRAKADDFIFA